MSYKTQNLKAEAGELPYEDMKKSESIIRSQAVSLFWS